MGFVELVVYVIVFVVKALLLIVPVLLAVAFLTLAERKILGGMQRRRGPNVVGFLGLLQPIADGVKLLLKETVIPSLANKYIFVFSPIAALLLSLGGWVVLPLDFGSVLADINLGVLYLFAISSLGVYSIVMAGWSSNSRYAFLGALRSAAQMVSYEVSIGLILISVLVCVGSLNLTDVVLAQEYVWFVVPLFPLAFMFFVSVLAETNRAPFDLPEAEGELVAGYNVEYSSAGFALFFIGEYGNIISMSILVCIFFLGGWLPPFNVGFFLPGAVWLALKVLVVLFLFVWVRAAFPRYRYDQLMRLGWKVFLPLALGWVLLISGVVFAFDWAV